MTNPASTETVCAPADQCRLTCSADSDCSGGTPKCCADYSTPVCTATDACPVACSGSSSCNTAGGELCCTTIHLADPNGTLSSSLGGACMAASACPVACTQDSDCTNESGGQELCCNGRCAATCAKTCSADSDCDTQDGQLCCTNSVISSPWFGYTPIVTIGPSETECTQLSTCCGNLSGSAQAECEQIALAGNASSCESFGKVECQAVVEIQPDAGSSPGDAGNVATCGTTTCNGDCTDLQTDPNNCGACGSVCEEGFLCSAGACLCAVGVPCNDGCVDLDSDSQNCGTCGTVCVGGTCTAGTCSCAGGQASCDDACTDVQTDDNNCGECGNACNAGETCEAGSCACTSATCDGVCVDLMSDANNCGECGNVCPGSIGFTGCVQGMCESSG